MKHDASDETLRAVLIEDTPREMADIRERLEGVGGLTVVEVVYRGPELTVRDALSKKPHVVLVDFRLVKPPRGQHVLPSQGSSLAALLKEKDRMPDTPVFLISLGRLTKEEPLIHIQATPRSFDGLLIKEDIHGDPDGTVDKIRAVVSGYRRLAAKRMRTRQGLFALLGAREADFDVLMKADPPPSLVANRWDVTEGAQWVRHTLMAYPGVLYDGLTAACFLGLSLDSFGSGKIAEFFGEARYGGPFFEESERWWTSLLLRKATTHMLDVKEPGPPMAFGQLWRRRNRAATLSHCNSSGEEPADCVCYVLREPVRREYSLPYRPDARPAVMDEARVSYRAIREARKGFDPSLVAPDARSLIDHIRNRTQ